MSDKAGGLDALRMVWGGFWSSRVVMTANNLGFFEHLQKPLTARAAARATRTDPRAAELLMNALASLGLIKKTRGKFRNTPTTSRYLTKKSPVYQGDILRHAEVLWKNWSGLDRVLRTGKPNHAAGDHLSFIMGMHNISVIKVKAVLSAVGLRGVSSALDLGGGPGTYTFEMAGRGIKATLFDFPETLKIAKRLQKKLAINDKNVLYMAGDFTTDAIGNGYDLVLVSQILHAYTPKECLRLLKKSTRALNPGGRVAVQEFPIAPDMASPAQGALFAINMLVNTDGGRCYPAAEIKEMLGRCGLREIKVKPLAGSVLVVGTKKG